MGQTCCQEEGMKGIHFERISLQKFPPISYEEHTIEERELTKEFPVAIRIPHLGRKVQEILSNTDEFCISKEFVGDKGEIKNESYALNTSGLVYSKGSEWKNGLPHGRGKLIYPDGSYYEGYFNEGVINGEGRFISAEGWWYQGGVRNEQAEGYGYFFDPEIDYCYEGEWRADLPDGKGREEWESNDHISYEGDYLLGKKHGYGIYTYGNKWTYIGHFIENEFSDKNATIKYENGDLFRGSCVKGKKHGQGIYRWANGSTYSGEYENNERKGFGKFSNISGKSFEGYWEKDKRNGEGKLMIGSECYNGVWENDIVINVAEEVI